MNGTISITGLGIICAIGNDATSVLDSLRNRRTGIRPMKYLPSKHNYIPVGEVQLSNDEMKQILGIENPKPMSRTTLMGAIAVRQALEHAGITDLSGRRVALISGTTVGGMDIAEQVFEQMKSDDSLLWMPKSNDCGDNTKEIADVAGLHDAEVCTITTACSSALSTASSACFFLCPNVNRRLSMPVSGAASRMAAAMAGPYSSSRRAAVSRARAV